MLNIKPKRINSYMSDDLNNIEDEIDELASQALVDELMANPPNSKPKVEIVLSQPKPMSEDSQIEKHINDNVQTTTDIVTQVMTQYAKDIGDDPDRLSAFASIVKANNDTLKILNAQIIRGRDNQTKIEVAKIKQQGEIIKDVMNGDSDGKSVTASRDDVFKEIFKEVEEAEIIDENGEDYSED
jgi:hypothetical protein